jgi:hypothetical protein
MIRIISIPQIFARSETLPFEHQALAVKKYSSQVLIIVNFGTRTNTEDRRYSLEAARITSYEYGESNGNRR